VGTTPGGSQIVSPQSGADGRRRLPALGNAGPGLAARVLGLQTGVTYYWSVQSIDPSFIGSAFAPEASFTYELAGVGAPASRALSLRASPNPFVRGTTLELAGPGAESARVRIFDPAGRVVRDLGICANGSFTWDGRDAAGVEARPGIYLARVTGGATPLETRLVKLR